MVSYDTRVRTTTHNYHTTIDIGEDMMHIKHKDFYVLMFVTLLWAAFVTSAIWWLSIMKVCI
jgi:hypothetical protein